MSWVAALPEDQRDKWLAQVAALLDRGEMPSELPVHVLVGLTEPETSIDA